MKVVQINVTYRKGSTGKIVYDIHQSLLKKGIESIVYYGRGAVAIDKNVYKLAPEWIIKMQSLYSKITGYGYKGSYWSTKNLILYLKKEKPDIVHLQCINGNTVNIYKIINYLKTYRINTILTMHSEFLYTGGCGYSLSCEKWKTKCINCPQFKSKSQNKPISFFFDKTEKEWDLIQNAYNGFDNIVITCVSEWLANRAKQSPLLKNKKIEVVMNGLDTSIFYYRRNTSSLINNLKLHNKKIILHVTPNFNSPIKGGNYVLELAKLFENRFSDYIFIIVGYNGNADNLPSNVIPIAFTSGQSELSEFYSIADITLLTSEKETFSMICAESLSCGTPVVGFKAGAPETISMKEYSHFVPFGEIDTLFKAMIDMINKKYNKLNISNEAHNLYSKEKMTDNYIKIYKSFLL